MGFVREGSALLSVAGTLACWRFARNHGDQEGGLAVFWCLACHPLWLVEVDGQGHNDAVMVLLVLLAALASRRGRRVFTTAGLALAAAAKYIAVAPFGMLWLWWSWRGSGSLSRRLGQALLHGGLFLAVVTCCYAPFWEGWRTVTYPWSLMTAPRFTCSFLELVSWTAFPWGKAAMLDVGARASIVPATALVLIAGRMVWAWKQAPATAPSTAWDTAFVCTLVYLTIVRGFFLPWYVLWLFPILVVVGQPEFWTITVLYGYLGLLCYVLDFLFPYDTTSAVRPFLLHVAPLIMLVRVARGRPVVWWEDRWRIAARLRGIGDQAAVRRPQADGSEGWRSALGQGQNTAAKLG